MVINPNSFVEYSSLIWGLVGIRANTDFSSCGRPLTLKMLWCHQQSGDEDRWMIIIFNLTFYCVHYGKFRNHIMKRRNYYRVKHVIVICSSLYLCLFHRLAISLCLSLCMCVCIYMYTHLYMYTFIFICIYMCSFTKVGSSWTCKSFSNL